MNYVENEKVSRMTQHTPRKIIIDTDPGQDDAVAILMALASPQELEILGLTVVAGNVPLDLTSLNARKICELAGRFDIKIFNGAAAPLARPLVTAEHVHGKSGLDGVDLPAPTMALQTQHAVDFMIETLRREACGTVTLCPLGPLTNIALALRKAPDIASRIAQIVMMGGSFFEGGNVTATAEFNIYVDPEAADEVCRAGIPIVMLPLDVTHKALVTRSRIADLRAQGTKVADVVADLIDFYERFDIEKYGCDGAPLHDPCVIGWLLRPELFSGRHINVRIETHSDLTLGMSVADWWNASGLPANALFLRDVDADKFFELVIGRIARLGAAPRSA